MAYGYINVSFISELSKVIMIRFLINFRVNFPSRAVNKSHSGMEYTKNFYASTKVKIFQFSWISVLFTFRISRVSLIIFFQRTNWFFLKYFFASLRDFISHNYFSFIKTIFTVWMIPNNKTRIRHHRSILYKRLFALGFSLFLESAAQKWALAFVVLVSAATSSFLLFVRLRFCENSI